MKGAAESGLFLEGLHCAGCVGRVERALRETAGVEAASVDLATQRAFVAFDPALTSAGALARRVESLGYRATPYDPARLERPARRDAREALARVLVASFLAGNVMVAAIALYIGDSGGMSDAVRRSLRWLCVGLSLPAVTWCALPFWRGALRGLRRGEIPMDVPIALGIGAAFAGNLLGTLADSPRVFADSAAMIVFLILLGRTLERGARARAAGAVERLLALAPRSARRVESDGTIREVPAASLRPGDVAVVAPGEAVPADGRVAEGETELDESLLTGESAPVARRAGDPVTGGSRNALAEIRVEVMAAAEDGTLARMAALLERAQAERPGIQRVADRVARVFAPAVLAVAAASAVTWAWAGASALDVLFTAAAVLIVACPCALGLATPAAVTAAIGRAARMGVLVSSGEAFERLARVDHVVLDKTGTLTEGALALERVHAEPPLAEPALLALAAAAEGSSLHPVAAAIRRAAAEGGALPPEAKRRRALAGRGIEAEVAGERVCVGTREFLRACGARVPERLEREGRAAERAGLTLAWVSRGGVAVGVLGLCDPLRADAAEAVAALARLGVSVSLVSGDHARAVDLAAARAGIAERAAGVSPDGKVERVRRLRARGARVLVAGDGINDAAALAAADVGIAMARGAEVALEAADAVVKSPRCAALPESIALARATVARIRENLGLALAYNAVAVPLAAAGLVDPLHAAVAMSLSSLAVTGNAVRLLRWRAAP